jgi:hypothetical protein
MAQKLSFIYLLFVTGFCHAQHSSEDSSFLTPASVFETAGMKCIEKNKRLRVYTKTEDRPNDVSRAVDIRWVFSSSQEAADFLEKNLEKESEGGYPIKKVLSLPNAAKVYIYREEPMSVGMYEMTGAENAHWYYIFVIDRIVAKVFTAGNKTSMSTSYKLAFEAAKHISQKLGLAIRENEISTFDLSTTGGFKEKIEKGKLIFYPLPGFEPGALPDQLKDYFDQEFVFPGEKYCVRYFIIKNEEDIKGSLEDSMVYKKYWQKKVGASQSVSLNIMMPDPSAGRFPRGKENANRASCHKINNSDFIIEYAFSVSDNSVLAKGYKYCYMYATYKQNAPDCYVVFLSDDARKLGLFSQMHKSSIKYKD